jgi:AmpD protein
MIIRSASSSRAPTNEDAQYDALAKLLPVLRAAYPAIAADRIVGHSDVAPGRKTDPGDSFDWSRVRRG